MAGTRGVLLALTGHAGVGKDEFADCLVRKHGYVKLGFSDVVCKFALLINPKVSHSNPTLQWLGVKQDLTSIVNEVGYVEAKKHPEVRSFLQCVGTVLREELGEDVLVNSVMPKAKQLLKGGTNVVITNARTKREARAILEADGTLLRVHQPGVDAVNGHHLESGEAFGYASFDVHNDSTVSALECKATELHNSMVAGLSGECGHVTINASQAIKRAAQTVDRALGLAVRMVVAVAAPDDDLEEYVARHRVNATVAEDGVRVVVDDELAGEVTCEDGVLTVEAFIARQRDDRRDVV